MTMAESIEGCGSSHLESSDWYRAVTLFERIASLDRRKPREIEVADESIRLRLERWISQYPQLGDNYLSAYLAANDISREALLQVLNEPLEAVRDRLAALPSWLQDLRSAFSDVASDSTISFKELSRGSDTVLFLNLIEPLIRHALHRLRGGVVSLRREIAGPFIVDDRVEDAFLANVARQLLQMLIPTLVLELNVARLQGSLEGETQEQRFGSFVARLRQPDTALALLREYPALTRQAVVCLDHWVTFSLEFLRHLAEDWSQLCIQFGAGEDVGRLVSLDDSKGDQHRDGRSVLIVTFSSGFRIVYKPRPLAVAMHFQELLNWLNDRGAEPPLRTIKMLDRGAYGWIEFISPQGCASGDEVRRFYARQGEYLALLYALEATDFHYENLIAAGEHPILVDLETLFQPYIRHRDQTISRVYRDSVLRLGLLPQRLFASAQSDGIDLSGLGAAAGQALPYSVFQFEAPGTDEMRLIQKDGESAGGANQPTLKGADVDILDYVEPITVGFATLYRLLLQHRDELLSAGGPLARFAGDRVRVVLRPTLTYGLLLRSSFHPDALRDALDRDMMFSSLWGDTQGHRHLERIFTSEMDDLQKRDIPLFTTCPGSHEIATSSGQTIADFFPETGLSLVHRRLRDLGESDYLRQLWFIRASLATTAVGREPARLPPRPRLTAWPDASRRHLMAAAEAVGKRLDALALHGGEDIAWIGLTLTAKDNWCLVPLGLDLYNGLPGVALFLAYLGMVSQETCYTTLAKTAVKTIRRHLSASPLHSFSIGAFDGLGGIVFLLTHLGVLWNDPEPLLEAKRIAESLRALIFYDRKFDITSGSAGCLMSLLALQSVAPCENTLAAAVECGDHLLGHAQSLQDGIAWPPYFPAKGPLTGFAHGASGIALALLELFELSGEKRFREAALKAFSYENSLFSSERKNWPDLREMNNGGDRMFMVGWCHGAPGIALARLRALKYVDGAPVRNDIAAGLETTLSHGFRGDHSLCHGSLGNLEPLLQASELLDRTPWTGHVNRVSAAILQSINDDGWFCGVPLGVESPGLMTGLAGIGYGLLRLADPLRIPALLILAPPISWAKRTS
jgi:type 2 lantibiotic biosynthesis protein LanM